MRIWQSLGVFLGAVILVFAMVRLTGDPSTLILPRDASLEQIEAFREEMGYNRPLIVQFVDYAANILRGDFGNSLHYKTPAVALILERIPATLQLATAALVIALVIGLPLGIIAGVRAGSIWDTIARLLGLIGQTMPSFWLALLLILTFAVNLRWFPAFGRDMGLQSLILPGLALSLRSMGRIVRLTRSSIMDEINQDYVRTAYSKGLPRMTVYTRHVLKNAAIPLLSVLSVQFGYLLSGSIYIEVIFSWPGVGQLIAEAIHVRDFPLIQAIAVFVSVVIIGLHLLTDLAYALLDPRIQYD